MECFSYHNDITLCTERLQSTLPLLPLAVFNLVGFSIFLSRNCFHCFFPGVLIVGPVQKNLFGDGDILLLLNLFQIPPFFVPIVISLSKQQSFINSTRFFLAYNVNFQLKIFYFECLFPFNFHMFTISVTNCEGYKL